MYRVRESIIDKIKRIPVIALIFVVVAAFLPLVVLLLLGEYEVSSLIIPLVVGFGVLIASIVVIILVANKAAEPLQQDLQNLKDRLASVVAGNFSSESKTEYEELAMVEEDVLKLSASLKQMVAGTKGLAQGRILDVRAFPGEFKEMATGLNDLMSGYVNNERSSRESLQTAMNLLNSDLKAVAGSLNSNRRSLRVNPSSYPSEWKEVAENLKKYVDEAEALINSKNEELTQMKRQADDLKKQVDNLNQSIASQRQPAYSAPPVRASIAQQQVFNRNSSPRQTATGRANLSMSTLEAGTTSPDRRATRHNPPPIKSTKVVAPSGAHEYDKRDFGKY